MLSQRENPLCNMPYTFLTCDSNQLHGFQMQKKPTNITCTMTAFKYLQVRFRLSFRLYILSPPRELCRSKRQHRTQNTKQESQNTKVKS